MFPKADEVNYDSEEQFLQRIQLQQRKRRRSDNDLYQSSDSSSVANIDTLTTGTSETGLDPASASEDLLSHRILSIPRLDSSSVTPAFFHEHIEARRIPCIFSSHLTSDWRMMRQRSQRWTIDKLASEDCQYARVKFKVDEQANEKNGQEDEEEREGRDEHHDAEGCVDDNSASTIDSLQSDSFKLTLHDFMHYLHHNSDDVPLYIFDAVYDCDPIGREICDEYRVPSYFDPDLFAYLGAIRRPPYRWLLIGPERSGSALHTDPLSTSAWNTCIDGVKRWSEHKCWTPTRIEECDFARLLPSVVYVFLL